MKLLGVLLLCAFAAAVPTAVQKIDLGLGKPSDAVATVESRNILINALIRQLFTYIRYVINNGSAIFGLPPLDPLVLENYHLYIPAGFINLDLNLKDAMMTGIGGFVVHTSDFVPSQLSFDLDISVPSIVVSAGKKLFRHYDLIGDLLTAVPLYGKGEARFQVDGLRLRGKVLLKQSEDGKSVLIDRVINSAFEVPNFKVMFNTVRLFQSELTGVIGGGDIDKIVNAVIEDVIVDYVNRFQGAIAAVVTTVLPAVANPLLEQLDTWRYIERFV
ncbi:hypothetical protein MSG28_000414 [Choristoneura fumiferana]|uniref:Uncharacterized protein n=1 Tax=Choristoneura fumiferana TaxID=7141 RepID=A0ACC0K185_CHOFU|nr:hypothetical protein MSG28_000414 [Choristoneura fumiferana]